VSDSLYQDPFRDEGGVREFAARWVVTGDLEFESPVLMAVTPEIDTVDSTILRDEKTGRPKLTGATLAGALRSHLADVIAGYRKEEPADVCKIFGSSHGDDSGFQSVLITFDSLAKDGYTTEIRDGVALDSESRTAEEHKKFTVEMLSAGATFPLRFELLVEADSDEQELLTYLVTALEGLENGDIRFGTRKSRGLGKCKVRRWRVKRYNLTTQEGWLEWLATDHGAPLEHIGAEERLRPLIEEEFGASLGVLTDARHYALFEISLRIEGGLLIRSPGLTPDAPDVSHLETRTSGSKSSPIISGTSLAGALRNASLRVAQAARMKQGDAEAWINKLFGPRIGEDKRDTPSASRVIVEEAVVEDSIFLQPTRVKIDRFTGGAMEARLFTEEPVYGGVFRSRIIVKDPKKEEIGLLLLCFRDLITGEVPIGGSASAGRGTVTGQLHIKKIKLDGTLLENVTIRPDRPCPAAKELEKFVQAFLEAGRNTGGGSSE